MTLLPKNELALHRKNERFKKSLKAILRENLAAGHSFSMHVHEMKYFCEQGLKAYANREI